MLVELLVGFMAEIFSRFDSRRARSKRRSPPVDDPEPAVKRAYQELPGWGEVGNAYQSISGRGCFSPALGRLACNRERKPSSVEVKVVVAAMFERGEDTGDVPGEYPYWWNASISTRCGRSHPAITRCGGTGTASSAF
jgi:hypothetical protein